MTEQSDELEILALIHANRIAFWTHDFEAYEKCFVHARHTTRWSSSRAGGIFVLYGWENIAQKAQLHFSRNEFASAKQAHETTVENLNIRVQGDMAWATYNQCYPMTPEGISETRITHEVRICERQEGVWRIAFMGFLDDHADREDTALLRLAPDGTVIGQSNSAQAALGADDDLVIRAGRLRIRDSRADQKLQAGIKWAAQVSSGMFHANGALPLVLTAGEGLPTKVWWIIAESGMILFSIRDEGLAKKRLEGAAVVYGLSPVQKRLTAMVAEGMTLAAIAIAMNITPNTARTHLQRIFDKTGVHSQAALVRVLLSASAPI